MLRLGQMTTEELEDFKKMCENPEKIYVPEEDYDIPTHGLDKLIKKLQHQMEEHK